MSEWREANASEREFLLSLVAEDGENSEYHDSRCGYPSYDFFEADGATHLRVKWEASDFIDGTHKDDGPVGKVIGVWRLTEVLGVGP